MRLLLDSHIASALSFQLADRGHDAAILPEWQSGAYRSASEQEILRKARDDRRVLVTFDCHTIPPLLKEMAETGEQHGGVILVSSSSFRANDAGALLRALLSVAEQKDNDDWEDAVVFLTRSKP